MIHGVWIGDDGSVRYRNRFVWTPHLRAEVEAGEPRWAGLLTPYLPGPDVVPAELADDYKPLPDINIVRHGGHWLALGEVDPPWEVTEDLDPVRTTPFTWNGAIPGMCAHPKIDPRSGELVLFRYNFEEPYLTWATVAADGAVTRRPTPIDVDGTYMIHDFVVTEHFVVVFVGPAVFDLSAMLTGTGDVLAWRPERGTRIAVVPRSADGGGVRWIDTDPFWVWHFANGFEDGGEIVVDFSRFSALALGPAEGITGAASRARLDPAAGSVRFETLDDRLTEFPRIDDRLQGRSHRYFTASAKSPGLGVGEYDTLLRFDTLGRTVEQWDSGTKLFGEVAFARAEGRPPEEGYYVTFRTDVETLRSDWVVLDASDIAGGPVAVVELPVRVPAGLHGNWFPT